MLSYFSKSHSYAVINVTLATYRLRQTGGEGGGNGRVSDVGRHFCDSDQCSLLSKRPLKDLTEINFKIKLPSNYVLWLLIKMCLALISS